MSIGRPLLRTSYREDAAIFPTVFQKVALGIFLLLLVLMPFDLPILNQIPLYRFLGDGIWLRPVGNAMIFAIAMDYTVFLLATAKEHHERTGDAATAMIDGLAHSGSVIFAAAAIRVPRVLHPIDNEDLRLLLLENISQDAVKAFQAQGFHVDHSTKAMSEDELVQKISQYHAIGIRSKTKITKRVLEAATKVRASLSLCPPSANRSAAPRHRMLLHRHQPSRSCRCCQGWYSSLQLSLLELPLRC